MAEGGVFRSSLPDAAFFPLAALLAGAMVVLAVEPFAKHPPTGPLSAGGRNAHDVLASGDELRRLVPGGVGGIDFLKEKNGKPTVRLTRLAGQVYQDPRMGVHLVLAEDLERVFSDRQIEVTIEARSTGDFAATAFEADYFAKVGAASGWKSFSLTHEFAPYSFTYKPPPRKGELGYDYLGIRPVAPDKRRTMEIRSVRFRTVE